MNKVIVGAARKLAAAKRLWFALWAAQTALALLVALPLLMMVSRYLGHSQWAEDVLRQLDLSFFNEFSREYGGAPSVVTLASVLAAMLAVIFLQVLVSGGVVAWLRQQEGRPAIRTVLHAGAQWFWPMTRLILWALIAYGLLLALDLGISGRINRRLAEGMEGRPGWILLHTRIVVGGLIVALINVMVDYARVHMIATERRSAWRAMLWSWRFTLGNLGRVANPWVAIAVVLALLFAAKSGLDWLIPATRMRWIALGVLVQQAYVLSRIWTKLMFWATANEVYTDLNPPYRPPAPPPLEAPLEEMAGLA
jgi:hypothetical protein